MGLYAIKPWFVARLKPIEDRLVARRVSPNTLTHLAIGTSVAAGSAIAVGSLGDAPAIWFLVAPLCLMRLGLNALDGAVARRTGTDRPLGQALNEIGDRIGDAVLIGSIGAVTSPALAAWGVAAAFGTSFVGVLGKAITDRRASSGPMGKADRIAVIAAASFFAASTRSVEPFVVSLWIVIAGCAITALFRIARMAAEISDAGR